MDLHEFLDALDRRRVAYRLDRVRDALMVIVPIPGERWEIEFFADGSVEAEKFITVGELQDSRVLQEILGRAS